MSFKRELDFKIGNGLFRRLWVSSPSSTTSADGLGPLFNARSCQRCRSEEHTSELQSLMRISYAVFCLKKKKNTTENTHNTNKESIEMNKSHNTIDVQ